MLLEVAASGPDFVSKFRPKYDSSGGGGGNLPKIFRLNCSNGSLSFKSDLGNMQKLKTKYKLGHFYRQL